MEGDWDEIGVTDTDNREFVLQDVIEQFYDLMIEKVSELYRCRVIKN